MSAAKLIDCPEASNYDELRIWQELLVYDPVTEVYKIRTVSDGTEADSPLTCANKDNWDVLRILQEVVLLGDDGLLYLNVTS